MYTSYPVDFEGYLINSGSKDLIQPDFLPLLGYVTEAVIETIGDNLIALYIRGSISSGVAYLSSSDADFVAITQNPVEDITLSWRNMFSTSIQKNYSQVSMLDLTIISLNDLLQNPEFRRLQVYLITRSVLLYGKDLQAYLGRHRPDQNLAQYLYPDIVFEFDNLKNKFADLSADRTYLLQERPYSFWCVWTMRTLIRSAQALVMAYCHIYETDLKSCCSNFIEVFPELQKNIEQAYVWAIKPTNDPQEVLKFLNEYLPAFYSLWQKHVSNNSQEEL